MAWSPANDVLIGPAKVGSVKSIGLTPDGQAQVALGIDSSAGPMHQGTVARVYENSLSGLANKYVVLEPGPADAPKISDGGLILADHTRSLVNLDQLFDTLNPATRAGLRGFIRGEAASIEGRAAEGNQTLQVPRAGAREHKRRDAPRSRSDEPVFDALLVQGAQALQALGSTKPAADRPDRQHERDDRARSRVRARRCSRRSRCCHRR